jgi:hypothetical protein
VKLVVFAAVLVIFWYGIKLVKYMFLNHLENKGREYLSGREKDITQRTRIVGEKSEKHR